MLRDGEAGREIHGGRRLPDAPLLIRDRHDEPHAAEPYHLLVTRTSAASGHVTPGCEDETSTLFSRLLST